MSSYKDLNPLEICSQVLLTTALSKLHSATHMNKPTPFVVELIENPRYSYFGRNLAFVPGSVSALVHDAIHIILGRGFLPEDEAFVIGFTFGSTQKWSRVASLIYRLFSKHLYPKQYRFTDEHIRIIEFAVCAGRQLAVQDFSGIDLSEIGNNTLEEIRQRYVSDWFKLMELYQKEASIFSSCPAYFRLSAVLSPFS